MQFFTTTKKCYLCSELGVSILQHQKAPELLQTRTVWCFGYVHGISTFGAIMSRKPFLISNLKIKPSFCLR